MNQIQRCHLIGALCLSLLPAWPASGAAPADTEAVGNAVAKRLSVQWGAMPKSWVRDRNVMDSIWAPLGFAGVNYYAFGGPVPPKGFASRLDPASPNYQAWFGVYLVVPAGGAKVSRVLGLKQAVTLAELDQRSWLQAMGDPHPLAQTLAPVRASRIMIDGVPRTLYSFDMKSHSDLGSGTTPLAQSLGMPPTEGRSGLADFHSVTLHVITAFWYDAVRKVSVVTYGVSTKFQKDRRHIEDTGPELSRSLRAMMIGVRPSG